MVKPFDWPRPRIAGGTSAVSQKLLEAVFGDQAVRSLAERARADLQRRTTELLAGERARYTDVLDNLHIDVTTPDQLRQASRRVDDLRFLAGRDQD